MRISVVGFKGGCGKSTTSIHLAAYLQTLAPTLLVDGDTNASIVDFSRRGKGLPFAVATDQQAKKMKGQFAHMVVDTQAKPSRAELVDLAASDLMVIPSSPDAMSLAALLKTIAALREIGADRFKVLLTIVPPKPSRDDEEARALLEANRLPIFDGCIHRRAAFQKAALAGMVVRDIPDRRAADAWQEYEAIGKQIIV